MKSSGSDDDVERVFNEVCQALNRGDDNCITLRLSSKRYRLLPVQGRLALAEIDPYAGRVRIRTRELLPRHTGPGYPEAVFALAEGYGLASRDNRLDEVEMNLARAGISLPDNLRDNGRRMKPLDVGGLLGLQFQPDVTADEAAVILHALDDKRPRFVISRDWLVSEVRSICQRRVAATPRKPKPQMNLHLHTTVPSESEVKTTPESSKDTTEQNGFWPPDTPGRPTYSPFIVLEMYRRAHRGELAHTLAEEARRLDQWLRDEYPVHIYPDVTYPKVGAIENMIRSDYSKLKPNPTN